MFSITIHSLDSSAKINGKQFSESVDTAFAVKEKLTTRWE